MNARKIFDVNQCAFLLAMAGTLVWMGAATSSAAAAEDDQGAQATTAQSGDKDVDQPGFGPRRGGGRFADRDGGRFQNFRDRFSFSDEEKQELLDFLAANFPDRYEELTALKESDPQKYTRYERRVLVEMKRMKSLQEEDSGLYQVTIEQNQNRELIRDLAQQYRAATDETVKADLEAQLRDAVTRQVELRHERAAIEIENLEQRITTLRQELQDAEGRQAEIVDEHVTAILEGRRPEAGERLHRNRTNDSFRRTGRPGGRSPGARGAGGRGAGGRGAGLGAGAAVDTE